MHDKNLETASFLLFLQPNRTLYSAGTTIRSKRGRGTLRASGGKSRGRGGKSSGGSSCIEKAPRGRGCGARGVYIEVLAISLELIFKE